MVKSGMLRYLAALSFVLLTGCPAAFESLPVPEPATGFVDWPRGCPGGLQCLGEQGCAVGLGKGPHQLCTVECTTDADCSPAWAGDTCVAPVGGFGPSLCGVPCTTNTECSHMEKDVPGISCAPIGTPATNVCGFPYQESEAADETGHPSSAP